MRILIVEPSFYLRPGKLFKVRRMGLLGLALPLLAGLLPEHDVTLCFEKAEPVPWDGEWDLVLISSMHLQATRACEIADRFRAQGSPPVSPYGGSGGAGVPVVMGGYFPSLHPDAALEHCDAVVCGEAEDTLRYLVQTRGCRGKWVSRNDCSMHYQPLPRMDLVSKRIVGPMTLWPIQATRGCPRNCDFCVMRKVFGRSIRRRPVADVVAEVRAWGRRPYFLVDDNLTAQRGYALELFGALKGLTRGMIVSADPSIVDDGELLDAMRDAGVFEVFVGFESLTNPERAKGIGSHEDYERLVGQCRARGIMVVASLVFGWDWERPGVFDETLRLLERWRVPLTLPWILTPVPGSDLMARLKAEGRLLYGEDFWRLPLGASGMRCVYEPAGMSAAELEAGYWRFLRGFYSARSMMRRLGRPLVGWLLNGLTRRAVRRGLHPVLQ